LGFDALCVEFSALRVEKEIVEQNFLVPQALFCFFFVALRGRAVAV